MHSTSSRVIGKLMAHTCMAGGWGVCVEVLGNLQEQRATRAAFRNFHKTFYGCHFVAALQLLPISARADVCLVHLPPPPPPPPFPTFVQLRMQLKACAAHSAFAFFSKPKSGSHTSNYVYRYCQTLCQKIRTI